MSKKELKPCPFCKGEDLEIHQTPNFVYIECNSCDCNGPITRHDTMNPFVALVENVKIWNVER